MESGRTGTREKKIDVLPTQAREAVRAYIASLNGLTRRTPSAPYEWSGKRRNKIVRPPSPTPEAQYDESRGVLG